MSVGTAWIVYGWVHRRSWGRDVHDEDLDDTVIRPRREPRVPAEHDAVGDTVIRPRSGAALEDTVIVAPRPRAAPPGAVRPAAAPRRVASIRLGGRVVPLDRPVVVGRRPSGPRLTIGIQPELVAVVSPSGQVSSTHVTIHAEGDAVVVEDMRSTNGTFVRAPGAAPLRMRAGASMVVLTGTVVDLGDGVSIEILSPHQRIRPEGPATASYGATVPPAPGHPGTAPRGAGTTGLGSPEAERLTT